jgi:hypothetical protein
MCTKHWPTAATSASDPERSSGALRPRSFLLCRSSSHRHQQRLQLKFAFGRPESRWATNRTPTRRLSRCANPGGPTRLPRGAFDTAPLTGSTSQSRAEAVRERAPAGTRVYGPLHSGTAMLCPALRGGRVGKAVQAGWCNTCHTCTSPVVAAAYLVAGKAIHACGLHLPAPSPPPADLCQCEVAAAVRCRSNSAMRWPSSVRADSVRYARPSR